MYIRRNLFHVKGKLQFDADVIAEVLYYFTIVLYLLL